jgi:hypothetical protein
MNNRLIQIQLRFYEELNDFLATENRNRLISHMVSPRTSIKDIVESLGVPHTEIEFILVNGQSVDFSYQVQENDYISVYPVFETLDVSQNTKIHDKPLREMRFVLDVHLGKLAKYLRLLGFDTLYDNHFSDVAIVQHSYQEKRIVLTRDVGLLKHKKIPRGHWIHHTEPKEQLHEVLKYFDLYRICRPFTRCIECNGFLRSVSKNKILEKLPPLTQEYYEVFVQCERCQKIYWEGSHFHELKIFVESVLGKYLKDH